MAPCARSWTTALLLSIVIYVLIYVAATALSLPGRGDPHDSRRVSVRLGHRRSGCGCRGDPRRQHHLSGGALVLWRCPGEESRAGPEEDHRRLHRRRLQLSAVPAAGSPVSVLAGQHRPGTCGREAQDLRHRDVHRHHSRNFRVRHPGIGTRQHHRRADDDVPCSASPRRPPQTACSTTIRDALLTPQIIAAFVALGVVALIPVALKRLRARRQAT